LVFGFWWLWALGGRWALAGGLLSSLFIIFASARGKKSSLLITMYYYDESTHYTIIIAFLIMNTIKHCWLVGLAYVCCYFFFSGRAPCRLAAAAFMVSTSTTSGLQKKPYLKFSSIDVPPGSNSSDAITEEQKSLNRNNNSLFIWKDIFPLSVYATICLVGAFIISTYEDYDVTHTRPNPSTLRPPTVSTVLTTNRLNFIGAATKGMGWGKSNRSDQSFDSWYGSSATTLQQVRSYNEIMLEHRKERIPTWTRQQQNAANSEGQSTTYTNSKEVSLYSKEELKDAVLLLYKALDELDDLKKMADDYMWEEIKVMLQPITASERGSSNNALRQSLESMDVLKSAPLYYKNSVENSMKSQITTSSSSAASNKIINSENKNNVDQLPELIGFDWGSCAWRHCGAKADAQEALAELYSSVGMLEPFECRFIIDIIERSIRDVLLVIPDDLLPTSDGKVIELKRYENYSSQADQDYEYVQALNSLREILE
jgi:hypothetical protein